MPSKSDPILIIGGGLGGLTTALALAQRGGASRVLEGAPEFGAIGYGIQFGPNVFHVLDRIGVTGAVMAKADCPPAVLMRDALTGDELARIPTGASREETRLALYRSWVRWPVRRPPYREFQVPEISGATRVVSRQFVSDAHRAGVSVAVWTVNEEADMRRLLAWQVDALISDRPDRAVELVQSLSRAAR